MLGIGTAEAAEPKYRLGEEVEAPPDAPAYRLGEEVSAPEGAADTEAPGPWPPATPATPPQGALRHIAGAVGSALQGPYGPQQPVLDPAVVGTGPVASGVNEALHLGGAAVDVVSRPARALIKGGAATGAELFGKDQTDKDRIERDLDLGGNVAAMLLGATPMTSIPKPRAGLLSKVGRIDASDQAKRDDPGGGSCCRQP